MFYNRAADGGVTSTGRQPDQSSRKGAFMAIDPVSPFVGDSQSHFHCKRCGEVKPADAFYASDKGRCKECVKERVRRRRRTNPSVQEYDRARAKRPERKEHARAITRKWRAENPAGYAAHSAVSNALRDGRLVRSPCLFCESEHVHAHHRDYSKPLEVIWLCPKCHHRLHATFPEVEGDNKAEAQR